MNVDDPETAKQALLHRKDEVVNLANSLHPKMVGRGGGVRDIEVHHYQAPEGGVEGALVRGHARAAPPGGHPRRHGRQYRQRHVRGGGEPRGSHHRRQGIPAHPLQPDRPRAGAGPGTHTRTEPDDEGLRRQGGSRRHRPGERSRPGGPIPGHDAQQGHHERRRRRCHRHRQRLPGDRGRGSRLRGSQRPIRARSAVGTRTTTATSKARSRCP